jgi:uncharacterized protein YukE
MATNDRRSFDTAASAQAQSNLAATAGQLEALIADRDAQVKRAMADFAADGVSDEYHAKEVQWNRSATEVRQIIALVKTALTKNDDTATTALAQAKSAVAAI